MLPNLLHNTQASALRVSLAFVPRLSGQRTSTYFKEQTSFEESSSHGTITTRHLQSLGARVVKVKTSS